MAAPPLEDRFSPKRVAAIRAFAAQHGLTDWEAVVAMCHRDRGDASGHCGMLALTGHVKAAALAARMGQQRQSAGDAAAAAETAAPLGPAAAAALARSTVTAGDMLVGSGIQWDCAPLTGSARRELLRGRDMNDMVVVLTSGQGVGATRIKDQDWRLPQEYIRDRGDVGVLRTLASVEALLRDTSLTRFVCWTTPRELSTALGWMAPLAHMLHPGNAAGAPLVGVFVVLMPLKDGAHVDAPGQGAADAAWLALYDSVADAAARTDARGGLGWDGPPGASFFASVSVSATEWQRGWQQAVALRGPRTAPAPSAVASRPGFPHITCVPRGAASPAGACSLPARVPLTTQNGALMWSPPLVPSAASVAAWYAAVTGDATARPVTRELAAADAARFGVALSAAPFVAQGDAAPKWGTRANAPLMAPLPPPVQKEAAQHMAQPLAALRAAGLDAPTPSAWAWFHATLDIDAIVCLAATTPFIPRAAPPLLPWLTSTDDAAHAITAALYAAPAAARRRIWVVHPTAADMPHLPHAAWIWCIPPPPRDSAAPTQSNGWCLSGGAAVATARQWLLQHGVAPGNVLRRVIAGAGTAAARHGRLARGAGSRGGGRGGAVADDAAAVPDAA